MNPDGGAAGSESVHHLQLREFPHNLVRFNLTERELWTSVLEPWVRDRWIELGERKWSPEKAKLTVIEGPRIPVEELSMGRGWGIAQREGRDVTAQLLEMAQRASSAAPSPSPQAAPSPQAGLLADSLGLELLGQLAAEPAPLRRAWELAAARQPEGTASQALAVAELAVLALLRGRLIVLLRADAGGGRADVGGSRAEAPESSALRPLSETETARLLGAVASWTGAEAANQVWMRRV